MLEVLCVEEGPAVAMTGDAVDIQAGVSDGDGLSWHSSIDGTIGSAPEVGATSLSCGTHQIALEAKDSNGAIGLTTTDITVHGGCEDRVYVLPASAHVEGLEGTSWVSDVVLHNPGRTATSATLYLLDDGVSEKDRHTVSVPADSSILLADLLGEAFGSKAESGGVLIGAGDSLMLSSRTYNDTSTGTFGQYVPVPNESHQYRIHQSRRQRARSCCRRLYIRRHLYRQQGLRGRRVLVLPGHRHSPEGRCQHH